jgi:hypothetical protein
MDVRDNKEDSGKRAAIRSRRRFLAWNTLALLSLLLNRRLGSRKPPIDETALAGREALYYRKVGPAGSRTG